MIRKQLPLRYVQRAATMSSIAGLTLEDDVIVIVDNVRTIQPQTVYPATTRQRTAKNLHFAFGLKMLDDTPNCVGCHEFSCDPFCRKFNDLCESYMNNRFPRMIIFPASEISPIDLIEDRDVAFYPFKSSI